MISELTRYTQTCSNKNIFNEVGDLKIGTVSICPCKTYALIRFCRCISSSVGALFVHMWYKNASERFQNGLPLCLAFGHGAEAAVFQINI